MVLLSAASFCCCAAMALPFVHMVAYCGDLGYPAARGSEAVSLVLVSALVATFAMARLADRIGPLPVSLLCSVIQIGSLVGFMIARDITSIYALSLLHGIPFIAIVQGYALNLRFLYGPTIAGWRLGVVMLFAMAGMAVGGWLGGAIFDATLSYRRPSRRRWPSICSTSCCWARSTSPSAGGWSACLDAGFAWKRLPPAAT